MKMELIQPFINAADAVLAQGLQCPMSIGNLSMEEEAYRRKGVAALVSITGDIEGRIIFDFDPKTAAKVASSLAGTELKESDGLVREAVCELANQVIGNAVTSLNDQGFNFVEKNHSRDAIFDHRGDVLRQKFRDPSLALSVLCTHQAVRVDFNESS